MQSQFTQPMQPKPFGKLRNFLWPVHGFEHKKLFPMLALFFLISFIYNLLRCLKVTLVVTADSSGAEVIPFLKVWAVLPGAILLTYIYTKLSNRLNREQVFYTMLALFFGFFTIFLLLMHPNREALELTRFADFLKGHLPEGLNGLISIIRHWPLSLFYVLSELWSAVVLTMLFWGFANEVTSVDEAKRFYAIFAIGANFSGIFSGQSARYLTFSEYQTYLPFGETAWDQSLYLQLGVVLLLGIAIVVLFRWVNQNIVRPQVLAQAIRPDESDGARAAAASSTSTAQGTTVVRLQQQPQPEIQAQAKKPKKKNLSLKQCFSYLARSRYMVYITTLVVGYNIIFNIVDFLLNKQIEKQYPLATDFHAYINGISIVTAVFAVFSGLILSGNVIRRYGWTVTAMITPILWFIMGIGFFGCLLFENNEMVSGVLKAMIGVPITTLVLFFGSTQFSLGRALKYTVFDETKEIAFIPLPKENQRKGKAVVDGIASRFGKSGGSIIIQVLLLSCGELAVAMPFLTIIFVAVIVCWIFAVKRLGNMVSASIDDPSVLGSAVLESSDDASVPSSSTARPATST